MSSNAMMYRSFTILNYRAIEGPLEIRLHDKALLPLIGINECGKTTILQALFAFDFVNDQEYKGQHLENTLNLYKTVHADPLVTAEVQIGFGKLEAYWQAVQRPPTPEQQAPAQTADIEERLPIGAKKYRGLIHVTRNLKQRKYSIQEFADAPPDLQDRLGQQIVKYMPYILYNDDFQDRPPSSVPIPTERPAKLTGWLAIYERLFQTTDKSYSLFTIAKETDNRRRDSIVSDVQATLNKTLSKAWSTFLLDRQKKIEVRLQVNTALTGPQLGVQIVENIGEKERFFDVVDRSKGFLWFFNFVMKLEFNPKRGGPKGHTVYLLDEPGSYLHSAAQEKLCMKLRAISQKHGHVIYCTHSHHLLDPQYIPINHILIVSKMPRKSICLSNVGEYATTVEKQVAIQPILEALQIPAFDFPSDDKPVVALEGMYDKYVLELMLPTCDDLQFLPGTSADSIVKNIQFLNAFGKTYAAIWDNDKEGRRAKGSAEKLFGFKEAECFDLLPERNGSRNRKMEHMFAGTDLDAIKAGLNLPTETSYEHTIVRLYYTSKKRRQSLIAAVSDETTKNFQILENIIRKRLSNCIALRSIE